MSEIFSGTYFFIYLHNFFTNLLAHMYKTNKINLTFLSKGYKIKVEKFMGDDLNENNEVK